MTKHTPASLLLKKTLLALSLAGLSSLSLAFSEPQFQAAFQLFNSQQEDAVEKSAKAFADLLKTDPSHPLLMAWAGASHSRLATTTLLPWKKMRHVEDGLAQIDKALALLQASHDAPWPGHAPISLETRFVAINTFLALPDMFNRGPRGAAMLKEMLSSPAFAQAPLPFQAEVWLRAATQAEHTKRPADARKFYQQVIDAKAPQAAAASAKLKALQS